MHPVEALAEAYGIASESRLTAPEHDGGDQ